MGIFKKPTCLFIAACLVFVGGNLLLLNSFSWSKDYLAPPSKLFGSMTGKTFETKMKNDLLENSHLLDSKTNLEENNITNRLHGNADVELLDHNPDEKPLRTKQGNRGDLEHNMRLEEETDRVQTQGNVDRNQKSKENPQTEKKEQDVLEEKNPAKNSELQTNHTIAVLLISCNRPAAVTRCLDQLLKYRPSANKFPIIVSQDCGHEQTAQTIKGYGDKITHIEQPDLSNIPVQPPMIKYLGYYKISRHYKWALTQVFEVMKYDSVIIVEDDLDIAPDFFEYFNATRPLLDQDPSIWCISAWNDFGKEGFVQGNDLLYRTDFFPGLGWMLTSKLWDELGPKWPKGFWDDWIREPAQRRDRVCIRPEISRTKTFGKIGVSMGQFYDKYLRFIQLNDQPFPFSKTDLSYLMKENYDKHYLKKVYGVLQIDFNQLHEQLPVKAARIQYSSSKEFSTIAKFVGIMNDFKAGVPRTAYRGIVSIMFKGMRLYIAPPEGTWSGYANTK